LLVFVHIPASPHINHKPDEDSPTM